jgi:hypothetical protein
MSTRQNALFHTVLETFIHAQNLGLLDNIILTLGNQQQVIIGDMQGGNNICCSLAGYFRKMACLCHKCNVKGEESEPFVPCKQMNMIKICALVD